MRLLTFALTTSLVVGLLATASPAQQSAPGRVAVPRASTDQTVVHQDSQQGPRHAPAASPAEARAHARRLAEFRAWQQAQADQRQHSERARMAHMRRAAAAAASEHRQESGQPTRAQQPGAAAVERMHRMRSQGAAGPRQDASSSQSQRAPRPSSSPGSSIGRATQTHRAVSRPAPNGEHKQSVQHSSRSGGR